MYHSLVGDVDNLKVTRLFLVFTRLVGLLSSIPSAHSVENHGDQEPEDVEGVEEAAREVHDQDGDGAEGAVAGDPQDYQEDGQFRFGDHFDARPTSNDAMQCYQTTEAHMHSRFLLSSSLRNT